MRRRCMRPIRMHIPYQTSMQVFLGGGAGINVSLFFVFATRERETKQVLILTKIVTNKRINRLLHWQRGFDVMRGIPSHFFHSARVGPVQRRFARRYTLYGPTVRLFQGPLDKLSSSSSRHYKYKSSARNAEKVPSFIDESTPTRLCCCFRRGVPAPAVSTTNTSQRYNAG